MKLPTYAPDANAFAERFVRSVKSECLEHGNPPTTAEIPRQRRDQGTPQRPFAKQNQPQQRQVELPKGARRELRHQVESMEGGDEWAGQMPCGGE